MPPDLAVSLSAPEPLPAGRLRRLLLPSRFWRSASLYAFAALLSLACVGVVLQVRNFNPLYPYDYGGDSMLHTMVIKAIIENGWYEHIDRLSAPDGLRLEDFPMGDNLCCAIIRILAVGTSNPFLIQNLLFFGLFPVTTVVACWSLRRFGFSAGASLMGGMLYALLPYHFKRGTAHLFLGAYFLVPPVCLLAWWAMRGMLLAPRDTAEDARQTWTRRWRLGGSLGVCTLMGCNGVYYPFFACVVLAVAGVYSLVTRRDWRHFALIWALAALVGAVVIANLLPTFIYVHQHGKSVAGERVPGEAEIFGLKLTQLLLPITNYRWHAAGAIKAAYNSSAPLANENDFSSLGSVGSLGLLVLLAWAVFVRQRADPPAHPAGETVGLGDVLGPVSVLNLAAILFGTIGGFSMLFALLVSAQIRSYNRICVFIAFFSLLASAAVIDHLFWRRLRSPAARTAFFIGMLVLTGFGVWDQTSPKYSPDYHQVRHRCIDDARYFAQIEKVLPPGAMVFQLPENPFPEGGNIHHMDDYAHLRGFLQTRTLRWSSGAIRGRRDEVWDHEIAALPSVKLLQTLAAGGFQGLYLDGSGYADNGASEIAQFSQALGGAAPLLSKDRLTAFFDLGPHAARLLDGMNTAQIDALVHPLHVEWTDDFSGLEKNATQSWRWCGSRGDLVLCNDSATRHKMVQIVMECRSAEHVGTFGLHVSGDLIRQDLSIDNHAGRFAAMIDLPPGRQVLHFDCDAPRMYVPNDPRAFVWVAYDPVVKEVTTE